MVDDKKQNVSVRLGVSDLQKIKDVAKRLRVRESDVFRFAVKATLAKLIPLHDHAVKGKDLVSAFIECGTELANYFDLDAHKLEEIINDGVEDPVNRVDSDDIELLAMAGIKENYIYLKLKDLAARQSTPLGPSSLLRQHLYEKYVYGKASSTGSGKATKSEAVRPDIEAKQESNQANFVPRKPAVVS